MSKQQLEDKLKLAQESGLELLRNLNDARVNVDKLNKVSNKLRMENANLKRKIKALESLIKHGKIYVNTSSTDCDGVSGYYTHEFDSWEQYRIEEQRFYENLEGPGSFEMVDKRDRLNDDQCGSFGQGWGIN